MLAYKINIDVFYFAEKVAMQRELTCLSFLTAVANHIFIHIWYSCKHKKYRLTETEA